MFQLKGCGMVWQASFYKTSFLILFGFFFAISTTPSLAVTPVAPKKKAPHFKKIEIQIGTVKASVELAETDEEQEYGLMYRQSLGPNQGMLFVFTDEAPRGFWMKNTFVDLSIGFFDQNKKLVDIQEMKAVHSVMETPNTYQSRSPAKYALEMPKGWFKKNKVEVGQTLKIKP